MKTLNQYLKEKYGCKVYKLSISAKVTCPNRDGTLGSRGCIFCSEGGSGDFAANANLPIRQQIAEAKEKVSKKIKGKALYIAYFQSFTNTYASIEYLRDIYMQAIEPDDIVALSIGTRPDCLGPDVIRLLSEINKIKPVWVELGLQTIHEDSAVYIRRGYTLDVYDKAVRDLRKEGIDVITHVILGLPGETDKDMEQTVKYVVDSGVQGIKLQLLHVLKNTDLEKDYLEGRFEVMTMDEYIELLKKLVKLIPDDVIIHRLTGDGPKKSLVAPLWSGDKKVVLNRINNEVITRNNHENQDRR
ncbi:MAG: TIGR01212 family radical SAM protein [Butyrivibrio sp.]|jgi:radical SAM protein (TIGR01212 family)|nr:TIGR01212 family radical SAM protein [Butyrivibrio sp.]